MPLDALKKVLSEIVENLFGKSVEYRFLDDTFPYTDPSLQVEVKIGERWIEILGGGMPKKSVLKNFGIEGYNGWAFGFGLERLGIISMDLPDIRLFWSTDERVKKQLKLGTKFKEVSKFPPITRDISFVVPKSFVPNNYFDLIRDIGGDLVEEVSLLDKYENDKKFGADKMSYTYRIVYRSIERTLKTEEIDPLQSKVIEETKKQFAAAIR
jgi:phenylalanyl-tRNA synthetase alpha chain